MISTKKNTSYQVIKEKLYKTYVANKSGGTILPSENTLADIFQTSRSTIRKSINELVQQKLLYVKKGSGTYVQREKSSIVFDFIRNFRERAALSNSAPSTKVISFQVIPATEFYAEKLQIPIGTSIYMIERLRYLDQTLFCLECSYLPVTLFPELSIPIMENSKYDYIEKDKNLKIIGSDVTLIPITLDKKYATLLDTTPNQPFILESMVSYLSDKIPFEYTEVYRNPDTVQISFYIKRQ